MRSVIGFDATAAKQGAGIGRYTVGLVQGLQAVLGKGQLVLVVHRSSALIVECLRGPAIGRVVSLPFSAQLGEIIWQRLLLPLPLELFTGALAIFHSPNYLLPPLRRATGIVTIHDLSFLRYPQYAHPPLARYLRGAVQRAVRRAAFVLVDSHNTAIDVMELLSVPEQRVAVVYPGVGAPFSPIPMPEEEERVRRQFGLIRPYFLCVGTVEPRKNYPAIIDAFLQLKERLRFDGQLVIVGRVGWDASSALHAISQAGDSVKLLTTVGDEELAALYRQAVALVYASHYEGFGLPALEAMACGTPIILARNSSLPEVGGEAAFYCETDRDSIAEAMTAVLSAGTQALQHRVQLGLMRAQRFTWQAAAQEVAKVYRALA